jgi:hypothetical protein
MHNAYYCIYIQFTMYLMVYIFIVYGYLLSLMFYICIEELRYLFCLLVPQVIRLVLSIVGFH